MDDKLLFGFPVGKCYCAYPLEDLPDELEALKPRGKIFVMLDGSDIPWEVVHGKKENDKK